jgi:hypothetical protein
MISRPPVLAFALDRLLVVVRLKRGDKMHDAVIRDATNRISEKLTHLPKLNK